MRIGLVNFLNARPLDYGLRRNSQDQIVESFPSRLCELILSGDLDCALISSVECLRHQDKLDWCKKFAICSQKAVRSVLYIKKKEQARDAPIQKLWVDSASRSSVALWQCLYFQIHKTLPALRALPAAQIPERICKESGGILIGDAALEFSQSKEACSFALYDLGTWWSTQENLPFVFALWAYPRKRAPIEDRIFEESFAQGKANMDKIIEEGRASNFADAASYLRENIHYELGDAEHRALECFRQHLETAQLLS